jgi:predicted hydrocarbon binding protein
MTITEVQFTNLFELDATKGILTNRITHSRGFFFGTPEWAEVREELETVYSSAGLTILERIGFAIGKSLSRIGQRSKTAPAAFFEQLTQLAANAGWGRVTLNSGDPVTGRARFRVENCVFCSKVRDKEGPECVFLAGVIRGLAEQMFGTEHSVSEETCLAARGDACIFLLERRDTGSLYIESPYSH